MKFVTLTCGYVSAGNLKKRTKEMLEKAKILLKKYYSGALLSSEVKYKTLGVYYLHIHAICVGKFVDQRILSNEWRRLTGYKVVYVQQIKGDEGLKRILGYELGIDSKKRRKIDVSDSKFLAYLFKPLEFDSPWQYVNYLESYYKVKRIRSFGCLYGRKKRSLLTCYEL
ncbi:MAG: hypothetical protein QXM00_11080 [Candidatus Bathyarchaeia archaeon]